MFFDNNAVLYGTASRICAKQHTSSFCNSHLAFAWLFVRTEVMQEYNSTDMFTARKNFSYFTVPYLSHFQSIAHE